MAYRIIRSPEAIEDLEAIGEYIERDSGYYGKIVISKIIKSADKLLNFPKMGRMVPEIEKEFIHEFFYIVSYHLSD